MDYRIILVGFVLAISSPMTYACQGAPKGTVRIQIMDNKSICMEFDLEGKEKETKCITETHSSYKETIERLGNLKPGQVKIVDENGCQNT